MGILLRNPRSTEKRLDFDLAYERSFGHTGEENEIRNTSEKANNLRSEMNTRIAQEMDGLLSTVNSQMQRAIHGDINTQVLSQIQNTIRTVQNVNVGLKTCELRNRNKSPRI